MYRSSRIDGKAERLTFGRLEMQILGWTFVDYSGSLVFWSQKDSFYVRTSSEEPDFISLISSQSQKNEKCATPLPE